MPSSVRRAAAFSRIGKSDRLPPTIPTRGAGPAADGRAAPAWRATLLALCLGEAVRAAEDVELLDVGPARLTLGNAALQGEQVRLGGRAPVTGHEPGPQESDAVGRQPDRGVDLRAPALDEAELEGTRGGKILELHAELAGVRVGLDEDVQADRPPRDRGVVLRAVRPGGERRHRGRLVGEATPLRPEGGRATAQVGDQ